MYPQIGASHEIDSFNLQSDKFNLVGKLEEPMRSEVLSRAEAYYSLSKWKIREDFLSDKHITDTIEIIMKKNPDKNPGALFSREGMTQNITVLERIGILGILATVKDRIRTLQKPGDHRYDADPVRVFQKPEATKIAKAIEKRWRLIWGVSLIDQIIDRLLYTEVVEASIRNWFDQAAKPGANFKSGGTHRMVMKYNSKFAKPWTSFDASSFDFTVSGDQLDLARDLNSRLCTTSGALKEVWESLSLARETAVSYGSFVFSNGVVCKQTLPGIQKSGRYTTIDGNCKVTVMNRIRYDCNKGLDSDPLGTIAMGDDAVEYGIESPTDYSLFVKTHCGNNLTLECPPGRFEDQNFCSTVFTKTSNGLYAGVPCNWTKTAWTLAFMDKKKFKTYSEALVGLCNEYAFHEKWQILYDELIRVDAEKARSLSCCRNLHLRMEACVVR